MKRKISIWTAIILSGSMMMGTWLPTSGFTNSAVYAASEFAISLSPSAGANYVSTGANLRLGFDRQVSPQNGEITIINSLTKEVFVKVPTGSYGLVGTSNAFDIKWGADKKFASNTKYTASVPQGIFKDNAGNVSAAASWSFVTAPENDSSITAGEFSPANNTRVDAAGLTQLSFKLNKKLQKGGGTVRLMSSFSNDTVQEFQMLDGATGVDVQSDGSSTTVRLAVAPNKLAAGSNYYILIDSYALKADDNRTYAGISSGNVWSFSTVGGEAKNVTTVPGTGAVNVSTTEAFRLNFDRPMMPASGYITVSPGTTDDSRTRWVNVNSTSVVGGGEKTITFTPATNESPLLSGTTYTVTIPQGAFYDRDGNVFPASGPYSWTFTTTPLSGLAVSALSPADRSEGVDVTKAMTITFNRDAVYNESIPDGVALYKSNGGSTKIPVKVEKGSSTKEFIIRPATALEPASTYYVDIAKGVFTDANTAGLVYDGISGKHSWSFQTAVLDNTAPTLTSAQLENNRTIRLKYNETLNAGVALLYSSFAVTVNDEKRAIDSLNVQGDSVYITLSTGVAVGQVVKISYSGGLRTIQDSYGNAAGTFTSQQVTNSIQSALPTPRDGILSGTTVTLNFNDTLKAVSANAYSQFYVYADGGSLGVNSISSSGNTVVLGLNNAASGGQTVRVAYYAGSYPVQDSYSQSIANFNDFYIRNTSDAAAPVFQSAVGTGNKIVLTYNEGLSSTALPLNSQYSVLVGSTPNYVTGIAVSGNQVTLTLQTALTVNQYATISYVPGSAGLSDLNGNRAAYLNLQAVSVSGSTGTSVPDISSATISGDEITVTFSKNMQASTSTLYTSQFGVRVDGSSVGVQSYYVSGNVLKLTLSTIVKTGQVVDLSYMAGSGAIIDAAGIPLPSFTALSVYNGTGTSSANANRPAYLGTLAASEFGKEYPLLKSDSATAADDRSVYSQALKRYTLTADRLTASYDYLFKLGTSVLAYEVPSTEPAAYVALPLKPLLTAVNRDKKAAVVIRYGDHLYTLPLNNVDMNSLAANLVADSSNISLIVRIEKVPTGTFTPFEQKLGTQGLKGITGLTDIRLTAAVSGNYSSASALNVAAEYAARTTSTLNSDQTSAARLDLAYYDAVYLPTKVSTSGSYTVIRANTTGNQVVGTFLSTRTFSDMSKHWSNSIVSLLAAKNIIDSSYGSTFKPGQKITRAEFAVMLSRGLGLLGDRETAQRFRDVQPSTQTGDYIGAAAKAGIITGNTDATFRPDDNITREQLAIMIIRAMEYSGNPITLNGTTASALAAFKDKAKIQNQSAEFVAKAVQQGIILGMSATEFQPQGNATRAQAAVMLQRMLSMAGYL